MENTLTPFQSSSESGYFDTSRSLFESTPNADSLSTPSFSSSRKRKASFLDSCNARKLADVMEACPLSPKFSSTFNDSLMNHLEQFHIQAEESSLEDQKEYAIDLDNSEKPCYESKIFRSSENNKKKFRSAPNTPEKQTRVVREVQKRANTSSFVKNFSQINMQSPLNKEAYGILYPDLPPLEPCRKPLTPQKFKENLGRIVTPAKKCLFIASRRELFRKVFSNTIIVANIFKHLSDGDLYRLSMVSHSLKDSLALDVNSYGRYRRFLFSHKSTKENYRISPPISPERKNDEAEASPASKNFFYFTDIARVLNKNQSLVKCPRCNKASIVENFIGQCQDVNSCGYIYCQKCNSFANNPEDFRDKCHNAQLVSARRRNRLGDLSNSTVTSDYVTDSSSSFFCSPSLNLSPGKQDSGFLSECETHTPRLRAKRNLTRSLTMPMEPKAFALNNKNNTDKTSAHPHKLQRRTSVLPVIPMDTLTKPIEIIEPSSPPKVKLYSACSKQSRRYLKRLTR